MKIPSKFIVYSSVSVSVLTILTLIFACFDISCISHVNRARAETCCVEDKEIYYSKMVAMSFEKV